MKEKTPDKKREYDNQNYNLIKPKEYFSALNLMEKIQKQVENKEKIPIIIDIGYCLPAIDLAALEMQRQRAMHLSRLGGLITHLAEQRQAAQERSHGRITLEMRELTTRMLNAQADYHGMTGEYFYPAREAE